VAGSANVLKQNKEVLAVHLRSRMLPACVLLLCWFASRSAADTSNIVSNGNFAGGTYPQATDTVATGWTLLPADKTDFQIQNINGTFYAVFMSTASASDLAGGNRNGIGIPNGQPDQDCFYQTLTVVAGNQYTVSFSVKVTGAVGSNTLLIPQWNWSPNVGPTTNMMDPLYGSYDAGNGEYSAANGTGSVQKTFTQTAPIGDGVPAGSIEHVNLMFHGSNISGGNILLTDVVVTAASTFPVPSILPNGIVPIYSSSGTIQPGEWVSIYGTNLASGTATWTGNFPTSLNSTTVTINGKLAYLSLVSPGQINLQAPDDTAQGTVPVVVSTASGDAASMVTLAQYAPSVLLLDAKHIAGIIVRSDGSGAYGEGAYDIIGPTGRSLGYSTVAARAGDIIELYGTGFGPTDPVIEAGNVFSGAAPTTNLVTVLVNNMSVTPSFAGLSGAGLYQINLTVPPGLGTGDVSIQANVGGVQTPSGVVMSLQ
jgi:uncharacterized protein (TIGR03437 family)